MQGSPQYHLNVEVHFMNGTATNFLAREFDLDPQNMTVGEDIGPQRFTYKGLSGDEHAVFLVPDELAAIVVTEQYQQSVPASPTR